MKLIDLFFPRYCPSCGGLLEPDERPLCIKCNIGLPRIDNGVTDGGEYVLTRMFYGRAKVNRMYALMKFVPKSNSSKLVYNLKYGKVKSIGKELGIIMAQEAGVNFFCDIDCIVPVPITVRRREGRGYNQSEEIAKGISKVSGLPVLRMSVMRARFDGSQTELSDNERVDNVKDAFRVVDPDSLKGKHVLVVDDILTTGSTITEMINEMYKSGIRDASVMVLGKAR